MSSIAFNDGGAATLESPAPDPLKRFSGWTPDVNEIGPRETAVGTGVAYSFVFRTDYVVSFDVPYLTHAELAVAHRLMLHLTDGGSCTVNTDDLSAHSYTCRIREGTKPTLTLADRAMMEYTLHLDLTNAAAAALIAEYR
jgi:hypothetical protein